MLHPSASGDARPLPAFTLGGRRVAVDVPHIAFVTVIAAWCTWYCSDAWRAAANIQNLILVLPATVAALLLYCFVVSQCVFVTHPASMPTLSPRDAVSPDIVKRIVGMMLLLAAYVFSAPTIGFDVASFVYIFATLLFLGERRVLMLLLIPVMFCLIAVYAFQTILATPLPVLFFGEPS